MRTLITKGLSINFWSNLWVSLLIVCVVAVVGALFYGEFEQTIEKRTLMHLTSIKRLKRIQIEDYLRASWEGFSRDTASSEGLRLEGDSLIVAHKKDTLALLEHGMHDFTAISLSGELTLAFVYDSEGCRKLEIRQPSVIQEILLERTGMGESGESYLVGSDHRLRSRSRFMPAKSPYAILCATEGVLSAFQDRPGQGIIDDYRGIPVFSAYHKIDNPYVEWVILSEIDVEEASAPLIALQRQLISHALIILMVAVLASYLLIRAITLPMRRMKRLLLQMARGNFEQKGKDIAAPRELEEMHKAIEALRISVKNAISYVHELGKMNVDVEYKLLDKNDTLGKALVQMKEQLMAFDKREEESRLQAKMSLITGQENERNRLAKELHDGIGPLLTSLKFSLQKLALPEEENQKMTRRIDETIQAVRNMTYDLMPPALADFGVGKALADYVKRMDTPDIKIHYGYDQAEGGVVTTSGVGINLFRIVQELINNTLKYAKASAIHISFTEFEDKASLFYADDGVGFDVASVQKGSGLRNMKERVQAFDGYIDISSSDRGTRVEIEIPVQAEA